MPLHEEKAAYDPWMRLLFLIPAGLIIAAIVLAGRHVFEGALVMFADTAGILLIFYFILPRKYQIYEDRLKIVLGAPFAINIPLSTIKEVKSASGFKAFVYSGVRFATSTRSIVEIVRSRGMNYIISPGHSDLFVDILRQTVGNRIGGGITGTDKIPDR